MQQIHRDDLIADKQAFPAAPAGSVGELWFFILVASRTPPETGSVFFFFPFVSSQDRVVRSRSCVRRRLQQKQAGLCVADYRLLVCNLRLTRPVPASGGTRDALVPPRRALLSEIVPSSSPKTYLSPYCGPSPPCALCPSLCSLPHRR